MNYESTKADPWLNGTKKRLNVVYRLFYTSVSKEITYFIQMNYESTNQDKTKAKFVYCLFYQIVCVKRSCTFTFTFMFWGKHESIFPPQS